MSTLITYYVETNMICLLFVSFMLYSYMRESRGLSEAKWFASTLITVQVYCVADMLAAICKNQTFPGAREILWVANTVYIAIPLFLILFWHRFLREHMRTAEGPGMLFRVLDRLLSAAAIVLLLYALSAPLTHSTFYLDGNNGYHRMAGAYSVPAGAYVFMLYETVRLLVIRRRSTSLQLRQDAGILSVFALPCIFFSLIQVVLYGTTVSQVGFTMGLMIVYMGRQRNKISRDELTGLNNRREYQYAIDRMAKGSGHVAIVMVDADDFKGINDTYGHQEGDDALRGIAMILKKSCGHCRHMGSVALYRYGGDEFILIASGPDPSALQEQLTIAIEEETDAWNAAERKPYTLNLSVGVADGAYNGKEIYYLVKEADEAMYAVKEKRKHRRS